MNAQHDVGLYRVAGFCGRRWAEARRWTRVLGKNGWQERSRRAIGLLFELIAMLVKMLSNSAIIPCYVIHVLLLRSGHFFPFLRPHSSCRVKSCLRHPCTTYPLPLPGELPPSVQLRSRNAGLCASGGITTPHPLVVAKASLLPLSTPPDLHQFRHVVPNDTRPIPVLSTTKRIRS